jgi:XTP/dITP diphosphohydrolase
MKKLIFATNNAHKLEEVRAMLQPQYSIISLDEIGCHDDIPETAETLEGNALIKAQFVFDKYGLDCFADDTGLEIDALNGEPGVYSARYAGEACIPEDNIKKVLQLLGDSADRNARFRTSIALILEGKIHYFEGKVEGNIEFSPKGEQGFGYDPIFTPQGYDKSFAQLSAGEKNEISHRGLAIKKLVEFLQH